MVKKATREEIEQENKALKKELVDRMELEQELSESEEKYRMLFEHAGFAIALLDSETGERIEFNREAHECLGYTRNEFKNLFPNDIDFIKRHEEVMKHFKEVIKKGSDLFETQHITKNGEIRDVLASAVPIKMDGKYFIQSLSLDITDRKLIEKELREARDELGHRVEERTYELMVSNDNLTTKIDELEIAEERLRQSETDLKVKNKSLEEMNNALHVLLKRVEEDRKELEEQVLVNMKQLVDPFWVKLKNSGLNDNQKIYMEIIESHLNTITSKFTLSLSSKSLNLTPSQIQVASLVKFGRSSKEIAETLNVSKATIDSHRDKIRKKLMINNKQANLRTHLASLQ